MSKAMRERTKGVRRVSFGTDATLTVHQLFENAAGPLPISSGTFHTDGGAFLLSVSGSGYRATANGAGSVAFDIYIDGNYYGWSQVCSNNTESHVATVPVTLLIQDLGAGDHVLTLDAEDLTTTDENDLFNATAEEYVIPGTVS